MKFWHLLLGLSLGLNLVLLTIMVLAGIKASQFMAMGAAGEAAGPQPTTVAVGEVRADEWEVRMRSVGSVKAVEGITVRTEVAGLVEKIAFTPGRAVEARAVLVELDSSIERANLAQARAELDLAQRNLRRAEDLFATRSIPEADLDAARSQVAAVEARVASLEAQLAKKTIRAPFAGQLGIKQISVGQYLNPGEAVVLLQALDPVFVEFSLPQRELGRVREGLLVRARADAFPGDVFTGTLSAIAPEVDATSRNVRLQATFENPDRGLVSGLFVEVEVVMPERRAVKLIPSSSIVFAPYGDRVFVVSEGENGALTVSPTIVRLGEARGDFIEITEGLETGDRIVTAGAFKLREGAAIEVSDRGTVEPELEPTPANS
jgi:membrane fusion protein, multidrug efflux system